MAIRRKKKETMVCDRSRGIELYYDITEKMLEEIAHLDEPTVISAAGQSMTPTIRSGEKIVVEKLPPDGPVEGDILVFLQGDLVVCHRLVRITRTESGTFFTTKGDGREGADKREITPAQVVGKVSHVIRDHRRFDPYAGVYVREERTLRDRLKTLHALLVKAVLRLMNAGMEGVLIRLRVYLPLKKIYYSLTGRKLEYYLLLPRKSLEQPLYRYVHIFLEDITACDEEFYRPLERIGCFKVEAKWGSEKAASAKVDKITAPGQERTYWAVTDLFLGRFFRELGLVDELLGKACSVLDKLGVKELHAVLAERWDPYLNYLPGYLKRTGAEPVPQGGAKGLYLLKQWAVPGTGEVPDKAQE